LPSINRALSGKARSACDTTLRTIRAFLSRILNVTALMQTMMLCGSFPTSVPSATVFALAFF
jgi:hypothetical protein